MAPTLPPPTGSTETASADDPTGRTALLTRTAPLPVLPAPDPAETGYVDVRWRLVGTKTRQALETGGEIFRFFVDTLEAMPLLGKYRSELFRQTALLVLTSGLIIWFMEFVMGVECGLEATYTLKQLGAPLYSGIFSAWCAVREMAPYMWGYILSAKVGCGLVAELGSMRISEEIDALEVMGVNPRSYLVATRLMAAWLAMPFLYIVGLAMEFLGSWFMVVVQLHFVSQGDYSYIFWLFQNPADLLFSLLKVMAMGTGIVLVGCYYGYTARDGPVGVGKATAKSMILNLIWVHLVGVTGTQLFWGGTPNAPIGN
jgi:phospholipid/cholesterol/gamma-HCH transport system permease protein